MQIKSVVAREIVDSRGNPTVEVDVSIETDGKTFLGRAAAPSGASTGAYEAVELRDGEKRYLGKGVRKAVENVNKKIGPAIIKNEKKLEKILKDNRALIKEYDKLMCKLDGTENKSKLGANAIVATSMALVKAFANTNGKNLYEYIFDIAHQSEEFNEQVERRFRIPQPMFNILNGGKHAGNKLAIQEFMIIPRGKTFAETLQMGSEIYHILGKILIDKYGVSARNVGDEGGYAPPMEKTEDALKAIMKAIEEAGYQKSTSLAIDCAASSFYDSVTKTYYIDDRGISGDMLRRYYLDILKRYPITSIEDPFNEDDFDLFAMLTNEIGREMIVVGDDLIVTNPRRIEQAIEKNACNALLLKVNQIGTVSEAIDAAKIAKEAGWNIIVSHRSGETEDTFIADFAVGIGAEYIKTGAPARGERTAKYNQLLRIEETLTS
jgi:enolase